MKTQTLTRPPTERPTNTLEMMDTEAPTETSTVPAPLMLGSFIPQDARMRLGRGTINQIAVSPDGKTVAVAGATGLSLYSTDTFQELWSTPTSRSMDHLAFFRDGKTIASVSLRITRLAFPNSQVDLEDVYLWNASDGKMRRDIPIHETSENQLSVAFSPDGKSLAVGWEPGGEPAGVDLWDLDSGEKTYALTADDLSSADSLSFSSDGKMLAAGSRYETIVFWDLSNGKLINKIEGLESDLDLIALAPDGKSVAIGYGRKVEIRDIASGGVLFALQPAGGWISSLAFSPDGKILTAGDSDGSLVAWDPMSGHCLRVLRDLKTGVRSLAFSPDGLRVLAGSIDSIHQWDASTGKQLSSLDNLFTSWETARFLSGGAELALQSSRTIAWLDSTNFAPKESLPIPAGAVLSPDDRMVAAETADKKISIRYLRTGLAFSTLDLSGYSRGINQFIFSPDGKTAAIIPSGIDIYKADLWDISSGRFLRSLEFAIYGSSDPFYLTFSPDGTRVALGTWDWEYGMAANVYGTAAGEEYPAVASRSDYLLAFSPDGNELFTYCDGINALCLLDVVSGNHLLEITPPAAGIDNVVDFSSDGKLVAAGTGTGTVYVWDTGTGALIHTFQGHNRRIAFLSFSPDKKTLASASNDGTVVLWNV